MMKGPYNHDGEQDHSFLGSQSITIGATPSLVIIVSPYEEELDQLLNSITSLGMYRFSFCDVCLSCSAAYFLVCS